MSFLKKGYEELWKAIIRPPREVYDPLDLGPAEFTLENKTFQRTDLDLYNSRGLRLACSHFEPVREERVSEKLPCVIYLHGNSSSRLEALTATQVLLPVNITVFCLDTSGSGLSEGDFISLGWYERDDLSTVVEFLRISGKTSCIGLWGRSMGAATSLLHGDRDPSIAGMVIDSPFCSLSRLSDELARTYSKIPGFIVSVAKSMVRKTIKKKAGFNINDLEPIDHVNKCFIPAMFIAANGDMLISPSHTHDLYAKYAGDKSLSIVEGDHNSARPQYVLDSIAIFFYNTLQCESLTSQAKIGNLIIRSEVEEVIYDDNKNRERLNTSYVDSINIFSDGLFGPDNENKQNLANLNAPVYQKAEPKKEVQNVNLLDL